VGFITCRTTGEQQAASESGWSSRVSETGTDSS